MKDRGDGLKINFKLISFFVVQNQFVPFSSKYVEAIKIGCI